MPNNQEEKDCIGCTAIMGSLSWAFLHVGSNSAVVCTICGKRHNSHPSMQGIPVNYSGESK